MSNLWGGDCTREFGDLFKMYTDAAFFCGVRFGKQEEYNILHLHEGRISLYAI